ncbi:DUF7344 domain-containing protein [Halapricum desulfuricans]|uniref:Putative trancriptional regulator, ArsR family n=1 Tax=Halapricum desulfuricans TaxID=2841257 RepID=A0A897MTF9_9EURY|nr:hypothetical protein [Halapricum desulfuricans]QSG05420.1 putative trancriptional regulator, ArsR family [Halapricum desulfuricans]
MSSIGQATEEALEDATSSVAPEAEEIEDETALEDPAEPAPDLSIDVIFEVLKNERRRRVIEYLQANDGPAELGTVAEHIAALENDKEESAISYDERKRVYVGLYQCHLPKMDDMGVIDFNRARGRMELTDQAQQLDPYLQGPVSRRPWYHYYGTIVLGGLGMYAAVLAQIAPSILSLQVVLGGVLAAMAVCTVFHSLDEMSQTAPDLSLRS